MVRVHKSGARVVLESDELISSQYTTSIYKDGFLYGVDGRQDVGVARLRCLDVKTGKIRWTSEGFGKATLILAGDMLLAMKTDGHLVALRASPDAYTKIAEARISTKTTRALPALADGLFYVRDTDTLHCIRLGK
jgi:outer membrane protein assembly factor BamB